MYAFNETRSTARANDTPNGDSSAQHAGGRPLERPRLLDQLDRFRRSDRRLLTMWAPAGAGKTTALTNWSDRVRSDGETVRWLGATDLLADEPIGEDWLFVDDVDRLLGGLGVPPLIRLITRSGPGVRFVIAGRYEPSGFAAVTDAAGGRSVVPTRDLAFDVEDTLALALRFGLVLPIQDAETLTARTGGWAAGLALAMPYLLEQPDPAAAVARFGGDQHQVADYLVVRVLDTLDEDDRDILMRAAVGSDVPLALAVTLTGRSDVGAVLHRLSARNVLVSASPDHDGFRFHPILAGYMRAEFRRREECGAVRNHVAAASWYEAHGDHVTALEQALLARDPDALRTQIEHSGGTLLMQGRTAIVSTALRALPPGQDTLATLTLRVGMDAPTFPDRIGAEERLVEASVLLAAAEPAVADRWRPVVVALSSFLIEDPDAASVRLRELGDFMRSAPVESLDIALLLRSAVAWCLVVMRRRADAEQLLRSIQGAASRAGYSWVFLVATDTAATLAVRSGDWRTASAYEAQVDAVPFDTTPPYNRATARALLVSTSRAYARCEPVSFTALHRIDAADPVGSELGLLFHVRALLLVATLDASPAPRDALARLVQLVRFDGRNHPRIVAAVSVRMQSWSAALHGAPAATEIRRVLADVLGPDSLELNTLRLLAGTRNDHVVEHAVVDALDGDDAAWSGSSIVNAHLALASHACIHGRVAESAERVRRALDVSEEFGYAREFLACRGAGAQLVFRHRGSYGALEPYADHVLALAEHERIGVGQEHPDATVPLTPKEQELLLELPAHQTVAEIAAKHHLSVNTIKTHLRSIYGKLSATGRTEAVSAARRRGLL
ncbi:ATP/maltotriose-dependent transcriptional regulator MalT [Curtobacterium sp. PhB130]|uniref:LuxR C-terminal-related transcriptional regulator n=1 Tax=Curtobacterium sp. PhB130 TaxID=2485178 RepID=UPI000F4C3BEC|nr:LuxR C-terminal-related transcriptional regulator [Curtobacterium sp. PhB130]ROS73846.1 ATP/maltotriose-dependent transcriptional regulator MalT [Curtobacterium sp. PhB130]